MWKSMSDIEIQEKIESIQQRVESEPVRCIKELNELLALNPEVSAAWMLKAAIHFEREEHLEATEAFAHVIEKKPKNENASIGLFHSLWESGKTDAAFEEMKRYFREVGLNSTTQTAQDYRAIVKEINSG